VTFFTQGFDITMGGIEDVEASGLQKAIDAGMFDLET
jgi:hypothetical protein